MACDVDPCRQATKPNSQLVGRIVRTSKVRGVLPCHEAIEDMEVCARMPCLWIRVRESLLRKIEYTRVRVPTGTLSF